jgi:hypothetical protein
MSFGKDVSKVTRVFVSKAARFMDIDPLAGRRKAEFEFPQYFMKAILG